MFFCCKKIQFFNYLFKFLLFPQKNFCHFHLVKTDIEIYSIFISLFHITYGISCRFKTTGINNAMTWDFIFIIEDINSI